MFKYHYKTHSYNYFVDNIKNQISDPHIKYQISHRLKNQISDIKVPPFHPPPPPPVGRRQQYGGLVKEKSIACFQDLFLRKINLEIEQDTKLSLDGIFKRNYKCEKYLDMTCENISEFTKFRMSTHWLPIERGRYEKPKVLGKVMLFL